MDRERREFLQQLAALSAALAAGPSIGACRRGAADHAPRAFGPEERRTLDALAAHIVPTDSEAGAREAGCAEFIDVELAKEPFGLLRTVFERGLQALEAEARGVSGAAFSTLTDEQRDQVLRRVEQLRRPGFSGPRFIQLAVVLTLEGFLCDPRHGGNRGAVGWQFAGHTAVRWGPADGRAWRRRP